MLDLEDCRARARQLIVLANASEDEAERGAFYELAQVWLAAATGRPEGAGPPYRLDHVAPTADL